MALRGAALDSRPALPSRAPSARPRPARAARPVRAMASPKPGKSTAGEALDNFFQVRSCAVPRVRLPPGMPAAA